jgi:hypothetical protein
MNAPVTDKELNAFWGVEVKPSEIAATLDRQRKAFDADDLQQIAYSLFREINEALTDGDHCEIGNLIEMAVRELIASRASHEIYNKGGLVRAVEVRL